jgi:hypothetical protein
MCTTALGSSAFWSRGRWPHASWALARRPDTDDYRASDYRTGYHCVVDHQERGHRAVEICARKYRESDHSAGEYAVSDHNQSDQRASAQTITYGTTAQVNTAFGETPLCREHIRTPCWNNLALQWGTNRGQILLEELPWGTRLGTPWETPLGDRILEPLVHTWWHP